MPKGLAPRLGPEERVLKPSPLDRVVILGMGHSVDEWRRSCYHAPFRRSDRNQIWVLNSGMYVFEHDLVFDMHDWEHHQVRDHMRELALDGHYDNLKNHHKPVVSVRSFGDNIFEYPLAEVISTFKSHYFRCGVAYMVAYAMLCGVKKISFFGCDFQTTNESQAVLFEDGRACLEYWIARAEVWKPRRATDGVEIGVAASSELLAHSTRLGLGPRSLYGYEHAMPVIEIDRKKGTTTLKGFDTGVYTSKQDTVYTPAGVEMEECDDVGNILQQN